MESPPLMQTPEVLPIMAYTGRLCPKGYLFKPQVYERGRGISPVEVYEREGKSVISTCKKALQG